MRILITGSRGYIGSRLMKKLDRALIKEAGLENCIESMAYPPQPVGMDYNDGNLVSAPLPDADVIYHLAAHASVNESWNRPVSYMDNLRTTVRLVKEYPNAKIIFASTCSTKDPGASPYGFSKWAAAEYLKMFHKNAVLTMFPNVFGDSPRSVVDIFRKQESLKINGDGTNVRDYVHVDDIVDALIKARNWKPGEYELGSGIAVSTLELARATGKPYEHVPGLPEQKDGVILNTTPDWLPTIKVLEYVTT